MYTFLLVSSLWYPKRRYNYNTAFNVCTFLHQLFRSMEATQTWKTKIKKIKKRTLSVQPPKGAGSAHTLLPENLKVNIPCNDPYTENPSIPANEVTSSFLLKYEIHPFSEEDDLPNFIYGTAALQYFKVLREIAYDWTRAKHHHYNLFDSANMDQLPAGMRLRKNLEVVGSTPIFRLNALQIISEAEGKLRKELLQHYEEQIPKIEGDFQKIIDSMKNITEDELQLIILKLVRYQNEQIRNQKGRRE